MEVDKTTLHDLSIFSAEDGASIFEILNLSSTSVGKEQFQINLAKPMSKLQNIIDVQNSISYVLNNIQLWPSIITNGTLLVVQRFYDSRVDPIPQHANILSAFVYKLIHAHDCRLVKYSVAHCFDFIKGMKQFVDNFLTEETPLLLKDELDSVKKILENPNYESVFRNKRAGDLSSSQMLRLGYFILNQNKFHIYELIKIFAKLDAWYGMANAMIKYKLSFPKIFDQDHPFIAAEQLYHILLQNPIAYDVKLNKETNFIFLTGANMAGKSTFIRAVGTAVFLAHTGMGVPAKNMQLSTFDGLLSNINVIDNIAKGESYFYNEVQRIKRTVQKINDGRKWLILIDELFKGTNVEDAMKCSSTVIEGLVKIKNTLFILSTHLYEIGAELKVHSNINFNYFETNVYDGKLSFSYKLKDGISNDRLGYLILKNEGVVDLLEQIK